MLDQKVFESNSFDLALFLAEANGHRAGVVADMVHNPVEWCTKPGYKLDPATRTYKKWCYRCKNKNICESCRRQYKMDKFQIVMDTLTHFRADKVVEVIGTDEDCKQLRKEFGIERVIRVPKGDQIISLCVIEPREGDVVLSMSQLDAEYVDKVFEIPEGFRITGGYKRTEEEVKEDGEYIEVINHVFVVDASPEKLFDIHQEVIKRTPSLLPNAETLQSAIEEHERVFSAVCTEWEIKFEKLASYQQNSVRVQDIDWRRQNFRRPRLE